MLPVLWEVENPNCFNQSVASLVYCISWILWLQMCIREPLGVSFMLNVFSEASFSLLYEQISLFLAKSLVEASLIEI